MVKILIADDHPIMRAGTRQILNSFITDAEIIDVDTFKKAIHAAESNSFDFVVMDIGMPGGNSVKMVEIFKNKWPNLPILILSGYDEKLYALAFIKAGADGYISKDATESEFRRAVETIFYYKKIYLSEMLKEESFRMFIKTGKALDVSDAILSVREREIAQMFISGMGVSEIAALLHLHTSTISTHRVRIFKKMGVENMMDLSKKFNILN